MRSHRLPAALTVAVAVVAIATAASALVVPAVAGGVRPPANELLVGWVLLGVGVALVNRAPVHSAALFAGGVLWVAVGLAPYAPVALGSVLERLALVPTALLTVAAILLPRRRSSPLATVSVVAAMIVAVVAGAGWYRWAVPVLGVLTLAAVAPQHGAIQSRRSSNVQLVIGGGVLASGLFGALLAATRPTFVASLHQLVLLGAAAGIGWCADRGSQIAVAGRIDLEHAAALGNALGAALGTAPLDIVFATSDGGWLDSSGQPVAMPTGGMEVHAGGDRDALIASVSPAVALDEAAAGDVRRLLAAAGEAARLRAALREQADEIGRSRARLETAVDGERARLALLIECGPLATLAVADELLRSTRGGGALEARLREARATLTDVISGLDNIAAAGGLEPALIALAMRSGATATIDDATDLGINAARVVWFACAEALANAAKHAPGARVAVRLDRGDTSYELLVSDDGPGGADPAGGGLAGLRERALSIGATLAIESAAGFGTCVHVTVPRLDACSHVAGRVAAPIRDLGGRGKVAT